MHWALWVLVGLMVALSVLVVVTFTWASVMLIKIGRGDFGDLNDLGGDHGGVQAEP